MEAAVSYTTDVRIWEYKTKCDQCKSKVWFYMEDLERDSWKVSGYHFDGTAVCKDLYSAICPTCENRIFIPDEHVWPKIRRRVKQLGKDHT